MPITVASLQTDFLDVASVRLMRSWSDDIL
jgi:hypothetical protein